MGQVLYLMYHSGRSYSFSSADESPVRGNLLASLFSSVSSSGTVNRTGDDEFN